VRPSSGAATDLRPETPEKSKTFAYSAFVYELLLDEIVANYCVTSGSVMVIYLLLFSI
jgi:hypothetical protein